MTLPFPLNFMGVGEPLIQPTEWWKPNILVYTNNAGNLQAGKAGDEVRHWGGTLAGIKLTYHTIGADKPTIGTGGRFILCDSPGEVLRADPTSSFPIVATVANGTDKAWALIARFKPSTIDTTARHLFYVADVGTGNSTHSVSHVRDGDAINKWRVRREDDGGTFVTALSAVNPPVAGTIYTRSHSFKGTKFDDRIDGSLVFSGQSLDVGTFLSDQYRMMGDTTNQFLGEMHHVLLFNQAINRRTDAYWHDFLSNLPWPVAWFKAGVGLYQDVAGATPVTASGQFVKRWVDCLSSWAAIHNGSATFPTAQGIGTVAPNINFSGSTNEYLLYAPGSNIFNTGIDIPFTAIVKFRTSATNPFAATRTLFSFRDDPTGAAGAVHTVDISTVPSWRVTRRDNAATLVTHSNGTPVADTIYKNTHIFHGTSFSERINGVLVRDHVSMDVGTSTFDNLFIGASSNASTGLFRGVMYDIFIFDQELSGAYLEYWEDAL